MMKSRKQNQPLVIPTGYLTLVKSEKKSKYALKQRRQISRVLSAGCRMPQKLPENRTNPGHNDNEPFEY